MSSNDQPSSTDARLVFDSEHPALRGHFPGNPLVPGVLLLDEVLHRIEADSPGHRQWRIREVKFHRGVSPEQSLRLEHRLQADGGIRFELHCAEILIAEGTLERPTAGEPARTDD